MAAPETTPDLVRDEERLRGELAAAHEQIGKLTGVVIDQARALAGLAPPDALNSVPIRVVFEAYEEHRKGEHSWVTIRNRLRPLVRLLGDFPCGLLTPKKWAEHRRARIAEMTMRGQPPSGTTLNTELARAKTMMSWAAEEEQGFVAMNPLREAKREKQKPPRRTWLTEADLQRLLASGRPSVEPARTMFRAFLLTKADTGLRFNEVRRLRRDRVSVVDGSLVAQIPDTKNGKSHLVGLTPRASDALAAIPRCIGAPFYFGNPENRGRLYSASSIWLWFRHAAEACGLDAIVAEGENQVRWHDLRRSAATNAHNRGATLLEVQDMLNHSNPGITSRYVQRTHANAIKIARLMQRGADLERRGPRRAPKSPSKENNRPNEKRR